jgi:hypothetical protein
MISPGIESKTRDAVFLHCGVRLVALDDGGREDLVPRQPRVARDVAQQRNVSVRQRDDLETHAQSLQARNRVRKSSRNDRSISLGPF